MEVRLEEGHLLVPEDDVVTLPATVTPEFIRAVFAAEADLNDPDHPLHWFGRMSPEDRARFEDACFEGDALDLIHLWSAASLRWAVFATESGRWDEDLLPICYRKEVKTYLIEELLVTETGIWFARTSRGLQTTIEFEFAYGESIEVHLDRNVEVEIQRADEVKKILASPIVTRTLHVQTANGSIGPVKRKGPECLPSKDWVMAKGETFLGELDQ